MASYRRWSSYNENADSFSLGNQVISINARRFQLYTEDKSNQRNEYRVRWIEHFTTYIHEFAHMFVTYLSFYYVGDCSVTTPTEVCLYFRYERRGEHPKPESGKFFENEMFGGAYQRTDDQSKRLWANMVGIPSMWTQSGCLGIKLSKILDLEQKRSYTDADFDACLYQPNFSPYRAHGWDWTYTMYEYIKFFDDWQDQFPRESFAEPGRSYYNNDPPSCIPKNGPEPPFPRRCVISNETHSHSLGFDLGIMRTRCHETTMIFDGRRRWEVSDARKVKNQNRSITPAQRAILDDRAAREKTLATGKNNVEDERTTTVKRTTIDEINLPDQAKVTNISSVIGHLLEREPKSVMATEARTIQGCDNQAVNGQQCPQRHPSPSKSMKAIIIIHRPRNTMKPLQYFSSKTPDH